ncbi:hypothetical protein PENTCL1PPCAC_8665, partial [Pristionchus entomophagus]
AVLLLLPMLVSINAQWIEGMTWLPYLPNGTVVPPVVLEGFKHIPAEKIAHSLATNAPPSHLDLCCIEFCHVVVFDFPLEDDCCRTSCFYMWWKETTNTWTDITRSHCHLLCKTHFAFANRKEYEAEYKELIMRLNRLMGELYPQ